MPIQENIIKKTRKLKTRFEVVDLFCGVGGLSYGLKTAGFHILAGYDLDWTCQYAYETNTGGKFYYRDVSTIDGKEITKLYSKRKNTIRVLAGCAPCQPFSSYAFKKKQKDPNKYDLLYQFGRLVEETLPDIVTMENVKQILNFKEKPVLQDFVDKLKSLGYSVDAHSVYCPDYGIPQTRKRLVLLASKLGEIKLIPPTHDKTNYVTVRETIGDLRPIAAGEIDMLDPLHRTIALTSINLERIKATPYGGSWHDWPEELLLECHKKSAGRTYSSVYGRMEWDKPSPTMTTQCTGLGNGRFGHPEQDRAISVREAALLQTFPKTYKFFPDEKSVSIIKASRYIGNAVPPKLGEVIAKSIINHIKTISQNEN
ncbi:MAG: DNA (cytosine-5-)-methyltransferase [Bacteroidales bacterium]|nr:DNA (cytosine-5-)-methyltransferase [Bacteroidales bacterium]